MLLDIVVALGAALFFWYCCLPVHPAEQERRNQKAYEDAADRLCATIRKAGKL